MRHMLGRPFVVHAAWMGFRLSRGRAVYISELGVALSSSSSELRTSDCGCKYRPPPPTPHHLYQDFSVGEDRGRLKAESASTSRRLGFHIQARNLSGAKP